MLRSLSFVTLSLLSTLTYAATAEEWRGRSIYQIITDRFALPKDTTIPANSCDPNAQTWCGGTWNSIRENLDYVQDMGFSAIWIRSVPFTNQEPPPAHLKLSAALLITTLKYPALPMVIHTMVIGSMTSHS